MKSFIIIVSVIVLVSSCNNKKTEFEQQLIDNNWTYYPYSKFENNVQFVNYIKFYSNYSYKIFTVNSNLEFIMDHKSEESKWRYNYKNKILTIFDNEFRILSINKTNDTIMMEEIKTDRKSYLLKLK